VGQLQFAALPIRIGRNALNDCRIGLPFVSEFHARIEEVDGRIMVRDLGSKNGVFVRSTAGAPTRIQAHAAVDLAAHQFEFFVGPLRVQLEQVDVAPTLERERKATGAVLGNKTMLESVKQQAGAAPASPPPAQIAPSAPPPHLASLPPLGGPGMPAPPPPAYGNPGPMPPMPGYGNPNATPQQRPSQPAYAPLPAPVAQAPSSPPAGVGGAPGVMNTQHLDMKLEVLALLGLKELASSLVPGRPLESTGDVARLVTKLHDTIEVFCRCFIPLREGHAQFVSSMDLRNAASQRSTHRSPGYRQVEFARNPGEVAQALLDFRDPNLDAPTAIEHIFADLMVHQVALLDGVMRGVRSLLDELSPDNIERSVGGGPLGLNLGKYRSFWLAYTERYDQLSEEKQAFSHIFGAEFAEAYREYGRKRSPTGS
jgi:type VI secretion system protein ImpI